MTKIILSLTLGVFISFSSYSQSIRKNYREMTSTEKTIFVNALYAIKANGTVDQFSATHNNNFGQVHGNEDFVPWHRWFDYQFEQRLRTSGVSGASKIALPYWDWTSEFYTISPTDRETISPLWENSFLGQFNSAWSLGRSLGGGSLPTVAQKNNTLAIPNFANFWPSLEGIHNTPHGWVSGIMGSGNSPSDPAFYLHHNFIDKLWQDWHNMGNVTTFANNTMAGFGSGVPTVLPNDIIDSRSYLLKVWFAENGQVALDKYTVNGVENYSYTGIINVKKNFVVPAGQTCNTVSAKQINLTPGFQADFGAKFNATIDATPFNSFKTSASGFEEEEQSSVESLPEDLIVYPNPTDNYLTCFIPTSVGNYNLVVTDILGNLIISQTGSASERILELNLNSNPSGVYLLKLELEGKTYFEKVIKR